MQRLYARVAARPGRFSVLFILSVLAVAALPANWLSALTPWGQNSEWARLVLQASQLLLVLFGAVVPIWKWQSDQWQLQNQQIKAIVDAKPIVMTDRSPAGKLQIRNAGNSPAVNVWLVTGEFPPLGLGSLDVHESRELSEQLVRRLASMGDACSSHTLIAEARPGTRRSFSVTFNLEQSDTGVFRHGFYPHDGEKSRLPTVAQLELGGPIETYLAAEIRERLCNQRRCIAQEFERFRDFVRQPAVRAEEESAAT
jgi:hypothetical protein